MITVCTWSGDHRRGARRRARASAQSGRRTWHVSYTYDFDPPAEVMKGSLCTTRPREALRSSPDEVRRGSKESRNVGVRTRRRRRRRTGGTRCSRSACWSCSSWLLGVARVWLTIALVLHKVAARAIEPMIEPAGGSLAIWRFWAAALAEPDGA